LARALRGTPGRHLNSVDQMKGVGIIDALAAVVESLIRDVPEISMLFSKKEVFYELKVNTVIEREKCIGCGACVRVCNYHTISIVDKIAVVTACECLNCGHCEAACPTGAITVNSLQIRHSLWMKPG